MAYFTQRPTKRIKLRDDYYIDVYTKLNYADRYEIGRFVGNLSELANFAILRLVAGWNLDDGAGNPVPFSEENLGKVDGAEIQPVIDFVDELMTEYLASLNPETAPEDPEKKTLSKQPSASSEPVPEAE